MGKETVHTIKSNWSLKQCFEQMRLDEVYGQEDGSIMLSVEDQNMILEKFGEMEVKTDWNSSNLITDFKSDIGITVGLIDSMIYISRVLKNRLCNQYEVVEALKDLQQDSDMQHILNYKQDAEHIKRI